MKTIQPVTVWYNGQEVQASVLNAYCSSDNLSNMASFSYNLIQVFSQPEPTPAPAPGLVSVASGVLSMTGAAYDAWETNDYAYEWIASQLNLVITGPYVPPSPVTTTTTTVAPSTTSTTTTKKV